MQQMSTVEHPGMVVVLTTFATEHEARLAVRTLVAAGIAACGSVVPGITSFYMWNGELCETRECQVLLKIPRSNINDVGNALANIHTYEVPEFICLDVLASSKAYSTWVLAGGMA